MTFHIMGERASAPVSSMRRDSCRKEKGLIVNPRGTSGFGKTEFVRRLMAEYGWKPGGRSAADGRIEIIERPARAKPFGYRLLHPRGGRSLAVLGHYESTSGGGDTIRLVDGGTAAIIRFAHEQADAGCDDCVLSGSIAGSEGTEVRRRSFQG